MKIRHRLAFLFTFILFLILLVFSLTIYALSADFRKEDFFDRLKNKAETTAKLLIQVNEIDKDLLRIIDQNTLNALYEEKVLIFNRENELIYSSVDDEKISVNADLLERVRKEKYIEYLENDKEVIGLYYKNKGSENVILATANDKFGKRKLNNLKYILIFATIVSTVISAFMGLFFSRKVLEPIIDINRKVENIGVNNLNERLKIGRYKDEIGQLATNFNKMLERISDAYQIQKNFAGSASHELRTPLAIMSSQLEFANTHTLSSEEYQKVLKSLHEDVQNLIALVNTLLLLAKSDLPETGIIKEQVRVDELLFYAQTELQEYHPDYKISISFDEILEDNESLTINGNKFMLKTLFKNLMENACKFSNDFKVEVSLGAYTNIIK